MTILPSQQHWICVSENSSGSQPFCVKQLITIHKFQFCGETKRPVTYKLVSSELRVAYALINKSMHQLGYLRTYLLFVNGIFIYLYRVNWWPPNAGDSPHLAGEFSYNGLEPIDIQEWTCANNKKWSFIYIYIICEQMKYTCTYTNTVLIHI